MLNVMFLVYSGVNEDHAHALIDTTPCVIGWKKEEKGFRLSTQLRRTLSGQCLLKTEPTASKPLFERGCILNSTYYYENKRWKEDEYILMFPLNQDHPSYRENVGAQSWQHGSRAARSEKRRKAIILPRMYPAIVVILITDHDFKCLNKCFENVT